MQILANAALPGQTYLPADGPAVPVTVLGVQPDGLVLLRNEVTGATHPVRADFGLVPYDGNPASQTPPPPSTPTPSPPPTPVSAPRAEKPASPSTRLVARVTTTIKGGMDLPLLARHTLLLGDNGAGKSALVNAIELAAQGGVSDVAGREWTSGLGFLAGLCDPEVHADGLVAQVECRNQATGELRVLRYQARPSKTTKSGLAAGVHTLDGTPITDSNPSPLVLPVRDVLTELRASPERAQAFLLGVACAVSETDFFAVIPPAQADRTRAVWRAQKGSAVDRVLGTQAELAKLERAARKTAADAETAAEHAARTLDVRPTPDELTAAANAVTELHGRRTVAVSEWAAFNAQQQVAQANAADRAAQRNELQARYNALQADIDGWAQEAQGLTVPEGIPDDRVARLSALRLLCVHQVERATGVCPTCAGPLATQDAQAIIEGVAGLLDQNTARAAAQARYAWLDAAVGRARAQQADLEAQALRLATPVVVRAEVPRPLHDVASIEAELQDAQETADRLRGIDRAWAGYDALKAQQARAATETRDLEYLNKIVQDFVANRITEAAQGFVARVQGFLTKPDRFWLNTTSGRFGLQRVIGTCPTCRRTGLHVEAKGQVQEHTNCAGGTAEAVYTRQDSALSGAEWARVTMALAAATVPATAEYSVLIPEDRGWSEGGKTLKEALKGLSNYAGQILFPSTVAPSRGVPKGWAVIVLGRDGTPLLNAVEPSGAEIDAAMKAALG